MASYGSGRPIIGILGEFDANVNFSERSTRASTCRVEQDMAAIQSYSEQQV